MKKNWLLLYCLLYFSPLFAQNKNSKNQALPRPKLVVGIMVDQMRWDYLYRYYDRYQPDGFKRMLNEGFSCENTYIPYIPTITAVGHSTVYTGSVPAFHGITGNDFTIQATGKNMYCTEDPTVQTVGSTSTAGKMSPRNLLVSTITDELRLATNFRSKVIGVALKDRGGILPAGHSANAAYWFDDATGNWITSTYYMADLPAWVKQFNAQKLPEKYLKQDWNTLYNSSTYVQSTPDDTPYEGKFSGTTAPTLPVKTSGMFSKDYGIIRSTPYGNTLTLDMARTAIENEKLGQGEVTDFLAVSCSSPDYIGHRFGVNAIETEDTYLRLDKDLANFFKYLDGKVGKGNYTVFLTADHAAAHNPKFLQDHKIPAGSWPSSALEAELNKQLEGKYKVKGLILGFDNFQVNLNNPAIAQNKLNESAIKQDCIDFLKGKPGLAYVLDLNKVQESTVPAILRDRIINGYNADRSGAIQIILQPAWLPGYTTGTGHGAWNAYDAHIPLVWMGWGIQAGKTNAVTHMTDIAATLAALLHIQEPNGNVGQPITQVLK
ncbi:alkaline phosphatase PafA [Adhaeribacter radiodurans]|uniref:Alkaline phosphatase family protein n=1 Tax=Adhaeribacter radiodurans TaxID=2745197 RepID=A0A7L7L8L7_9BACT|nr:alkaline phosphatase PafA [Adhaeribacter radiodurans]QMU29083.1 alkaline phosphatase family protein [Adhaeribacter radiodurans]